MSPWWIFRWRKTKIQHKIDDWVVKQIKSDSNFFFRNFITFYMKVHWKLLSPPPSHANWVFEEQRLRRCSRKLLLKEIWSERCIKIILPPLLLNVLRAWCCGPWYYNHCNEAGIDWMIGSLRHVPWMTWASDLMQKHSDGHSVLGYVKPWRV